MSVTWGQPVPVPETRRVGSHVSNWYTDAAYTQVYDFSTPVTTNLTLYGKWETNVYTVTYIVDGEVYYSTQVDHGEYVTNPKNPTKRRRRTSKKSSTSAVRATSSTAGIRTRPARSSSTVIRASRLM